MINKKAQGLPLNLIVLAAIAALILVLVIAFTIGGGSAFFSKIFKTGTTATGDELSVVQSTCTSLCDQAKLISSSSAWTGTSYCSRKFNVDRDGDGKLGGATAKGTGCNALLESDCGAKNNKLREKGATCNELGFSCSVDITTATGESVTCTPAANTACVAGNCV